VSKTPHLNIENEADRDLFPARPRFYMNGFSRQSGYPVAFILTGRWANWNKQADERQKDVGGWAETFPIVLRRVLLFSSAHDAALRYKPKNQIGSYQIVERRQLVPEKSSRRFSQR